MTDIRHFDQSTWLAKQVIDAEAIGTPPTPLFVALPGARAPIAHERLLAYQAAGHDEHSIVQRTNARWEADNAERLAAHRQWVAGPYHDALMELRRVEMEAQAEAARKRAIFDRLVAERDTVAEGDG